MFGVLAVDKPGGITSRDVVNKIQRLLRGSALKVGHTGTLDPLATGVLLVAVGRATRLVDDSHGAQKCYRGTFKLGCASESLDSDTEIRQLETPAPDARNIQAECLNWIGFVHQVPPKYSAIHIDGKRAYELARSGKEFTIPKRQVEIQSIDVIRYDYPIMQLDIVCGTGTYIRTLGNDIAQACGSGAVMTELCRLCVGSIALSECVRLGYLESIDDVAAKMLSPLRLIEHMHQREVSVEDAARLSNGVPIVAGSDAPERCAALLYGQLVAIVRKDGEIYRTDKVFLSNNAIPQPTSSKPPHNAES